LQSAGLLALSHSLPAWAQEQGILVNDIHSQLNPTTVSKIVQVSSLEELQQAILAAAKHQTDVSICGSRHAGGGQQFGSNRVLIDTSNLVKVLHLDLGKGLLEVQSGIVWGPLLSYLETAQTGTRSPWGIAQKQTGADHLSIGGTLGANAHGQGTQFKPFVQDVESFLLVDGHGTVQKCSRTENPQLFKLVIGGYGLFGSIYSVTLRLVPRKKVERIVEVSTVSDIPAKLNKCIQSSYPYGSFQVNIDDTSDDFMRGGMFCSYRPLDPLTPIASGAEALTEPDWLEFVYGAHSNKRATFEKYSAFYQSTNGRINWSDVWQSGPYVNNYHRIIDERLHSPHKATEVLTEIYVPIEKLTQFMEDVRSDFLKNQVNLIYSTVRFIQKDDETFLPWAKQSYACIIFNLHTVHTPEGIEHSARAFRKMIDLAIASGGSYYLTYHRFARKDQVLACYPQFPEFLHLKKEFDPQERFQSDWYRHYREMFG
jgi:hypothetical protein